MSLDGRSIRSRAARAGGLLDDPANDSPANGTFATISG